MVRRRGSATFSEARRRTLRGSWSGHAHRVPDTARSDLTGADHLLRRSHDRVPDRGSFRTVDAHWPSAWNPCAGRVQPRGRDARRPAGRHLARRCRGNTATYNGGAPHDRLLAASAKKSRPSRRRRRTRHAVSRTARTAASARRASAPRARPGKRSAEEVRARTTVCRKSGFMEAWNSSRFRCFDDRISRPAHPPTGRVPKTSGTTLRRAGVSAIKPTAGRFPRVPTYAETIKKKKPAGEEGAVEGPRHNLLNPPHRHS
jgi:hypothetical protein